MKRLGLLVLSSALAACNESGFCTIDVTPTGDSATSKDSATPSGSTSDTSETTHTTDTPETSDTAGTHDTCDTGQIDCEGPTLLGPTNAHVALYGATADEQMADLGAPGDIDGDGHADLLTFSHNGLVTHLWTQVPTGSTDARLADASWEVSAPNRFFQDLRPLGDLSGDGVADFGLKTARAPGVSADHGAVYLLPGGITYTGTRDLDKDAFAVIVGRNDRAVRGFDGATDFDLDGYPDLLVTAEVNLSGSGDGYIYLLYGPLTGSVDVVDAADVSFQDTTQTQGTASVRAGDVNGDGVPDAVLSVNSAHDGQTGSVYVVYGPLKGDYALPADADVVLTGDGPGDVFGAREALAVADLDGDGSDELVVGAAGDDAVGTDAGAVFVFRGGAGLSSGAASKTADLSITGTPGSLFGTTLSVAALDSCGGLDLVAGATSDSVSRAYIFEDLPVKGALTIGDAGMVVEGAPYVTRGVTRVVGDVDLDGHPDLGMSGEADDPARPSEMDHGATWVWLGPF